MLCEKGVFDILKRGFCTGFMLVKHFNSLPNNPTFNDPDKEIVFKPNNPTFNDPDKEIF